MMIRRDILRGTLGTAGLVLADAAAGQGRADPAGPFVKATARTRALDQL